MIAILFGVAAWIAAAFGLAVLIGKSIKAADGCCPHPEAEAPAARLDVWA